MLLVSEASRAACAKHFVIVSALFFSYLHCELKIHLTFDHNFSKFRPIFKILSPTRKLFILLQGLPPHHKCVATLPCEIQKSEMTAELLLIPSKLTSFT